MGKRQGMAALTMALLTACGPAPAGRDIHAERTAHVTARMEAHVGDNAVPALVASGLVVAAVASAPVAMGETVPVDLPLQLTDTALVAIPPGRAGDDTGAAGNAASGQAGTTMRFSPEQVVPFAKKVEKVLAGRGAFVALLARKGRLQAEMPEGMAFTHSGFAVYSEITTAAGRRVPGYAVYNLYQQEKHPDVSDLVTDYPSNFFAGVAELEAGIIIPSPTLQRRLLSTIASPTYASLHNPQYSVIANPFTLGRQNCTEFVLDVLNAAIYQTDDIEKIKTNEKAYFEAQKVNVNPLKLMLGSLFSAEVSLSDQPGKPVTATFEMIGRYLAAYDKGSEMLTVLPD